MRELLERVATVLYTTSAACFEAVQAGRRAIYVGRDVVLDYDKLPDNIAVRCRSVDELRDLIKQRQTTGRQSAAALASWLEPVIDPASLCKRLTELAPCAGAESPSADVACKRR
jgi:hypothetical protein